MRLLTHNVLRNNSATSTGAKALKITPVEVRVDEPTPDSSTQEREITFVKSLLPSLDWETLRSGAKAMGLDSLPPAVNPEIAQDEVYLPALYHVLMDVHLVNGMLTCEETGREFPVTDGIVNMMLEESECR
jgi:multifunctional methyltransferase subunit TRM112